MLVRIFIALEWASRVGFNILKVYRLGLRNPELVRWLLRVGGSPAFRHFSIGQTDRFLWRPFCFLDQAVLRESAWGLIYRMSRVLESAIGIFTTAVISFAPAVHKRAGRSIICRCQRQYITKKHKNVVIRSHLFITLWTYKTSTRFRIFILLTFFPEKTWKHIRNVDVFMSTLKIASLLSRKLLTYFSSLSERINVKPSYKLRCANICMYVEVTLYCRAQYIIIYRACVGFLHMCLPYLFINFIVTKGLPIV